MEEVSMAKVSPELMEQLHNAGSEPVQAILHLQSAKEADASLTDAETQRISDNLLKRVAAEIGESAIRSNLLRSLRTLIVEAKPAFVKSLLQQPEIASASVNRTAESPLIRPKRKRPVE
jgi:hypothetical protein